MRWTALLMIPAAAICVQAEILTVPPAETGSPTAGKRVRQSSAGYENSGVYHLLYLPTDWNANKSYPVIVEYAGNKWKTSAGTPDGSALGYGITRGVGAIWICMPYVNKQEMRNQLTWWGDVDATIAYCLQTVKAVCDQYGGDSERVFIAGFSRGAIACNFIGLHTDEIAALWRGFIAHSHYDGVRKWGYAGSDRVAARQRLDRLGNRPQWISHENNVNATRDYLRATLPNGNFTFVDLPGIPHTDTWVLKDSTPSRKLRQWFWNLAKPTP